MKNLFAPSSVAVIGASDNISKWGNWISKCLIETDLDIYLVNNHNTVLEQESYTIDNLPKDLDVAVICISNINDSIRKLIRKNVKNIIVIGNEVIDEDIIDLLKIHNINLIGPNCAGIWSSNFPAIPLDHMPSGKISVISQSGGVIMDLAERLRPLNLGFSKVASIGNDSAEKIESLLEFLDNDSDTDLVALYFEKHDVPYEKIANMSKPTVLLVPWATPAAQRAAFYHTNSNLKIVHGAARNMMEFVGAIQFLNSKLPTANGRRALLITDTGGAGVLLASASEFCSLLIDDLSDELKKKISLHTSKQSTIANPIDLVDYSAGFSESLYNILDIAAKSNEHDLILIHIQGDENLETVKWATVIAEFITTNDIPVLFSCYDYSNPGIQIMLNYKIPVFREFEVMTSIANMICG